MEDKRKLYRRIVDDAAIIASRKVAPSLKQIPFTRIFVGHVEDKDGNIEFTLKTATIFLNASMPANTDDILDKALSESIERHMGKIVEFRIKEIFSANAS